MDPIEPVFTTNLGKLVDRESLGEVLDSFQTVVSIPIRIFNDTGDLVLERTSENPVCQYLGSLNKAQNRCMVIRQRIKALSQPELQGKEYLPLKCFCGLEYLVLSIDFQSKWLGKLVVGPYFPVHLDKLPATISKTSDDIDEMRIKKQFGKLKRLPEAKVVALANTIRSTMKCIFFAVHKSNVTAQMHTHLVQETNREITQKNRSLEEMVEKQKEFDRQKSNFLAMVSHELRTPLTSIIGYSDMLTEGIGGELEGEQKQFISTINAKGNELLKIISSILDFSKMDSGRLDVQTTPCNVRELVDQAVKSNKEYAARRGTELSVDIPAGIPVVPLDPEKIVTSISHLIDNAIKFSPPDSKVKISAQVVASDESDTDDDGFGFVLMAAPDMLEIAIEDYGTGISVDDTDALFAPFTQADESSTREHGGAGLGLAIVKQYVEAHGGRIFLSTKSGEGSRFSIRIPITNS